MLPDPRPRRWSGYSGAENAPILPNCPGLNEAHLQDSTGVSLVQGKEFFQDSEICLPGGHTCMLEEACQGCSQLHLRQEVDSDATGLQGE
eukprot:3555697-Amphidinium_carterae.1